MKSNKTVMTVWELWDYDVWGNPDDGFWANDRFCFARKYQLRLKIEINNPGTLQEFISAYPTDYQLGRLFSTRARISASGDDLHIYLERESDGFPIGEMHCISHESLSPIRIKGKDD